MRTLFLIRHAKSSWDNPGLRDINRPLNDRGHREAPLMASQLTHLGIRPDLIVSSPAKRAISTALFFAQAFDIPDEAVVRNENIYEAYPEEILRIISELPDAAHIVLMFGHNPTFTDVANRFTNQSIDNVPTCGIVHIESDELPWDTFHENNAKVKGCYFPKDVL